MPKLLSALLAAGFAASALTSAATSAATVDARFGLVGTGGRAFAAKFAFRYFTLEGNYAAGSGTVFSSVDPLNDPATGFSVVREVAKLNVRTDSLGQTNAQFQAKLTQYVKDLATWYAFPSWARGTKPALVWYSPNAQALAAAESLQIVQTIRREHANGITGTVWEIGNEPNLFPAITPAEYGAIFTAYRRIIKNEDAAAMVAMGSLFLPEPAEDLKSRMGDELDARIRAELIAAAAPLSASSTNSLIADVKNTLFARILALPAKEYLRQALLAASTRPDIASLHVYPYDDRAPFLDSTGQRNVLDTTFAGVAAMLSANGGALPLWITEFGNIEQGLAEDQVAVRTRRMVAAFRGNAQVAMWFHYKSTGTDEQFALFSTGSPPMTRLTVDAAFAPASGDFPCAKLNAVGRAYWQESHGGEDCGDPNVPPTLDSLAAERVSLAEGDSLRLRAFASDIDGGSLAFTWVRHNGDTLGSGAELTYHAGYRDAGLDTFLVIVRDGQGGSATRALPISIANTALRPAIANAEGGAFADSSSLAWGWEKAADPDLDATWLLSLLELYRDTAATPLRRLDSLATAQVVPRLTAGAGPLFARVRYFDTHGRQTPWSPWRRLEYQTAPVSLAQPAAPLLRHPGVRFDARGRRLPASTRGLRIAGDSR